MDPARRRAGAVVVDAGRVVAVGERGILTQYEGVEVVELGTRTLMPGLIDAHYHLCIAALHPRWADLAGVSLEELGARLRAQSQHEPAAAWVRAAQWDHFSLPVTRSDLDALELVRPIIVVSSTLHQCVVCSRGLEELGIGRSTADPAGGAIERGADGEPTGVLIEAAWSEAQARSLVGYDDPDRWGDHIEAHARLLWQEGITAVHDAATPPAAEAVYRRLAREGRLPVSVLGLPHPAALLSPPDQSRLAEGPVTGEGDEQFRTGPVKLFADGGAAPAVDAHLGGRRVQAGYLIPGVRDGVRAATEAGYGVAIHAMGNAGMQAALDALRSAIRRDDRDHRFRIEHATCLSAEQAQALSELGGTAVVQPGFIELMGPAVERLQFDDAVWLPFARLRDIGVGLAGSSDHPCAPSGPVVRSCIGATRRIPGGGILGADQAIAYEDWLEAFTAGAARAGSQENERGMLRPGLRADLAVLQGELDPLQPPRVVETWVGGERVWTATSGPA
ncbi:MAG: amidohydrolase family protein [Candidatus Dormibacteraeota bacterium]|nr:amidohydrolase family protein [Candidatus Dormibacteraeota bacterium]